MLNSNINFFCTRCRRRLQSPGKLSGTIISCIYCGQHIIVPSINENDWWDDNDDNDYITENNSIEGGGYPIAPPVIKEADNLHIYRGETTDPKITIPFDKRTGDRDGDRDLDDINKPVPKPLDDNEFLSRLTDSTQTKSQVLPPVLPNGQIVKTPTLLKFPPPLVEQSCEIGEQSPIDSYRQSHSRFSLFITYSILVSLLIFAVGSIVYYFFRDSNNYYSVPNIVPAAPVPIDGKIVYIDEKNTIQGDEGSLVFMFPPDYPKGKTITTSSLTSRNSKPIVVNEIRNQLKENGAFFLIVDSDGYFDTIINQEGQWTILVVSAHVLRSGEEKNKAKELEEISKYLYSPEQLLLANHKYLWKKKLLDSKNYTIEYNIGRVDGALLPK